jgi:hypothetical protein
MKPTLYVGVLVSCGAAGVYHAQGYVGEAQYTIEWNDNGNKNGVVEPGEKAIGKIYVSFSPGNGTWFTLPSGTQAQIRALHTVVLGVAPMSDTGGKLVPKDVFPFSPTGAPDYYSGNTIKEVIRLQLAKPVFPQMTFDNPAHVLDAIWDPEGDYTPREVKYQVDGQGTLVFYEIPPFPGAWGGNAPFLSLDSPITSFQVVPGPGVLWLGLVTAGIAARRGRAG